MPAKDGDSRKAREAAALRDNLLRRKAQTRLRQQQQDGDAPKPGSRVGAEIESVALAPDRPPG